MKALGCARYYPRDMATKVSTKSVLKQALALRKADRLQLVEELVASLESPRRLTADEEAGIREALKSMAAGRGRALAEVRQRVLASLKR